jgi:hypothetical protein
MNEGPAERGPDRVPIDDGIERVQGHGLIHRGPVTVAETDYDVIFTPARLRGTSLTYEAGPPNHEPKSTPSIAGRLLGPLFQAQPFAEEVHTLVLEDGREFDFRVLQPETNEIIGVSELRSGAAPVRRA